MVLGKLYREKICKAGERYNIEIEVVNPYEFAVEIRILQCDVKMHLGEFSYPKAGILERSNSGWIEIESPRMLLEGNKKATIKLPVKVPENVRGSYHSGIVIQTVRHLDKLDKKVKLALNLLIMVKVVTTVLPFERGVEIVNCFAEGERLFVDIANIGNKVITVKVTPSHKDIETRHVRIYPLMTQRTKLDISKLMGNGTEYKTRLLLDNEEDFIRPFFVEFMKGEKPKRASLVPLRGRDFKEKKGRRPYNLFLNLNFGKIRRGVSFSGRMKLWKLFFSASSNFRQTFYQELEYDFQGHRLSLNYQSQKFFCGVGSYLLIGEKYQRWSTMFNTGLRFKNTQASLSYMKEHRMINLNVTQRIFKKWFVRFYGFKSPYRTDWNLSLMIPIL